MPRDRAAKEAGRMQETPQASQLQLLFIELRVGLARAAIQAALLLNGGAAVALLLLIANILGSASQSVLRVDIALLKWALAVFGVGLFLGAITFVNAYVAQGAIASGQSSAFGNAMRRIGLGLIVGSLLLFLVGLGLVVAAI
jgi:hypothetical protein